MLTHDLWQIDVSPSSVAVDVQPASVQVVITVSVPDQESASAAVRKLNEKAANPATASDLLSTDHLHVQVESIDTPPTVTAEVRKRCVH